MAALQNNNRIENQQEVLLNSQLAIAPIHLKKLPVKPFRSATLSILPPAGKLNRKSEPAFINHLLPGDSMLNDSAAKTKLTIGNYDLLSVLASGSFALSLITSVAALVTIDLLTDIVPEALSLVSLIFFLASIVLGIIGIVRVVGSHHQLKGLGFAILPLASFVLYILILAAALSLM
jgi:hypothetical protein